MGAPIDEITKAADGLAECLGNIVAAYESQTCTQEKIEHARRIILLWHQIKYKEIKRARSLAARR